MRHKKYVFFFAFSAFFFFSITTFASETVKVCGTGDSQKVLRLVADAFMEENPGIKVEVPDSIGSSGGIRATADGSCDIGRVARPIKGKETALQLHYELFAYSPVVFAANRNRRDVAGLTTDEIIAVFSGRTTEWEQLGGSPPGKIYVAHREPGDSCRSVIEKNIAQFTKMEIAAEQIIFSTPELVATLEAHVNTIGYLPLAMTPGTGLHVLALNGVVPSDDNVRNGSYPLAVPLGIVWKDGLSPAAKAFKDYLFTTKAQHILNVNGTVPAAVQR